MAWKKIQYKLQSTCDMIMHSGQTADPLNQHAKALKQVSSKRAKTEADHIEMARIEFIAGLYMNKLGPVIPSGNIDAMLLAAAKKSKEGNFAKSGVFCAEHAQLEYDGPRDAKEMWELDDFRFAALVRVGMARVMRMRPIFKEWSAIVTLNVDSSTINQDRVDEWFTVAGSVIGLGDWRPQHGRFGATRIG